MIRGKLFTLCLMSDKPLHPTPSFPLGCGNNFIKFPTILKDFKAIFLRFPRTYELLLLEIRYQLFNLNLEKFMQYVSMLN